MSGSCPSLEALLAGDLAGRGPELDHARSCPACAALLSADRETARALGRLHDPLPPAGFFAAVMARVDRAAEEARRARRQLALILGAAVSGLVGALAVLGPSTLVVDALESARAAGAWAQVAGTVARALRPIAAANAVPLVASQVVLAGLLVLAIRRLVPRADEAAR